MPRTLLGIAAGIVFGVWWGLLWASAGGVIGAVIGFMIARYVHAGLFERVRWTRLTALLERAERGGWRAVTLIRLVPVIPHSLTNYALGLTRVRLGDYALGSLLGQLPTTIAATAMAGSATRFFVVMGAPRENALGPVHELFPARSPRSSACAAASARSVNSCSEPKSGLP